ncbi:Pirin-like protein [Alcanivorax hongdengensis A-11-3]|uniref:Pirin-like protein n=1 Tax=Alcanivorax hongdengensis A-11-3 TaxID=1177179 RepID=L0WAP8_9GAMM|nr:pirin family protein [Alcanivorax hongdengensis]EKF73838.1 Pirin-like protein [Alcanivorax hongdengensis A-11-3]
MSNTNDSGEVMPCPNQAGSATLKAVPSRKSVLGSGLPIIRHLPSRAQRLIGPWCFLDHIGPTTLAADNGVDVGTHPHIGLQTVTWLFEGALLHKDSLGYQQEIRPGQLNLMTAGHGICHSEESPPGFAGPVHGLQFWIALPAEHEDTEPAFAHHAELPHWQQDGARITLVVGELAGRRSPARVFSPLVGTDIRAEQACRVTLPVPKTFELGLCINAGRVVMDGQTLEAGELFYLGAGRDSLTLEMDAHSNVMLLGGTPLAQPVLLWWNFVGRDQQRIADALQDWQRFPLPRFPAVSAYQGEPLTAPPLGEVRLK